MIEPRLPMNEPSQKDLRVFFIGHLNRIYCAKKQLLERLPELSKSVHFLDLKQAIDDTVDVVVLQVQLMKQMYAMLDSVYHTEHCKGLISSLDEAFRSIG